jgi:hypothetical protein
VGIEITASRSTSQKSAIFSLTSSGIGRSARAMMMSGWMPRERSSRTLCWVGFVFSSPPPISGTSVTWM